MHSPMIQTSVPFHSILPHQESLPQILPINNNNNKLHLPLLVYHSICSLRNRLRSRRLDRRRLPDLDQMGIRMGKSGKTQWHSSVCLARTLLSLNRSNNDNNNSSVNHSNSNNNNSQHTNSPTPSDLHRCSRPLAERRLQPF